MWSVWTIIRGDGVVRRSRRQRSCRRRWASDKLKYLSVQPGELILSTSQAPAAGSSRPSSSASRSPPVTPARTSRSSIAPTPTSRRQERRDQRRDVRRDRQALARAGVRDQHRRRLRVRHRRRVRDVPAGDQAPRRREDLPHAGQPRRALEPARQGDTRGTGRPLYESWDHENVHFVTLDSTVLLEHWGHFSQESLNWLAADLKKVGPDRPVVIGFHHWIGASRCRSTTSRNCSMSSARTTSSSGSRATATATSTGASTACATMVKGSTRARTTSSR